MTDDIKLPPLPHPQIPGRYYDPKDMWDYARAAIKADRQQRGESVAMTLGQKAVAAELLACFKAWEPMVCVLGNVRARDGADLMQAILNAAPQPAAPVQDPTASEAVYAFSAWLTTRDQDVTIGSTQNAAQIANLVSLFVDSQGWDQPRDDYTDYLRACPKEAPQPAAQQHGEPVANCWSNNEGDSWGEHPADGEFVEGLKVGDEYELQASVWWWTERFRVIKAPDDTSDDYEVEPVSIRTAPQPATPAQEPSVDLMNALRNQRQIDRDGTEVGVSRQALDEAIALLARYGAAPKFGEDL